MNKSTDGMLRHIYQKQCRLETNETRFVPYFVRTKSAKHMYHRVYKDLEHLNHVSLPDLDNAPDPAFRTPDGIVDFKEVNPKRGKLKFSFAVNDNRIERYHRANNFTRHFEHDLFILLNYFFHLIIFGNRVI